MKKVDISESTNEIIENDEDLDKGYSKIPIDQINLNTEPISIINDFSSSFFDNNIKSYIKVFLGFIIFVIILLLISILSGKFHYEKPEISQNNNNNKNLSKNEKGKDKVDNVDNNNNKKIKDKKINLNLRRLNNHVDIKFYIEKNNLNIYDNF